MSMSDPTNWLTPIYTQWGNIGAMLLISLVIPESPAWCVGRWKVDRAKKNLRFLYKGVEGFDVDHQCHLLELNIEHERAIAAEQRSEYWYAIFKNRDGIRTVISFWTFMTQQFIGLQLFSSYGSYFFQQASVEDPFMVTCITNGVNIAVSIVSIYLADAIGRRPLACYGTTLSWCCNVGVGILGVMPKSRASDILLVLFAVFWSKYQRSSKRWSLSPFLTLSL